MNCLKTSLFIGLFSLMGFCNVEARISLVEFTNKSSFIFSQTFTDGTPYQSMLNNKDKILIDNEGAVIETVDGKFKIVLEDAGHSGFHRPHWKYHIWLESEEGFSFLSKNRILYAVIFYDGDGEVKIKIDKNGKVDIKGGYDVKDILYPWAVGTIGRGNPYHQIKGTQIDSNGLKFFDHDGFVGYSFNSCLDDNCESFDNQH